jgi:hypothetical protein
MAELAAEYEVGEATIYRALKAAMIAVGPDGQGRPFFMAGERRSCYGVVMLGHG